MPREKTGKEVVKIAARLLKSKDVSPDVKKVAASVLTQYEPKKKKRK